MNSAHLTTLPSPSAFRQLTENDLGTHALHMTDSLRRVSEKRCDRCRVLSTCE